MSNPFANIGSHVRVSPLDMPLAPFAPTAKDPLLTLADSAAELGISFRSLKQIIEAGGLKPDKTLGRIRLSQVKAYGK